MNMCIEDISEKATILKNDQPHDDYESAIIKRIKNLDAGIVEGETPYLSGQRSGFVDALVIYRDKVK